MASVLKLNTLVFLLCVLLVNVKCTKKSLDWWQSEVMYQIYPRSFKDGNGDGIGDLRGIYNKLHYIAKIGVGVIWISPIFESPMADFGYDIADYKKIWPTFGTMKDFEKLMKKAKRLGIKVLLDFVPNHTSDEHEWFKKSVKRIEPYTDFYVWKDPINKHDKKHPPNNWISVFGGSAWEWNEEREQYYLHQFVIKQPDLNYRNPVVREQMKEVIKFWLDKGVDGFRVDAVAHCYENKSFPDEPRSHKKNWKPTDYFFLDHPYSKDQPETYELVKDWREVLDKYSEDGHTRFMMTEVYGPYDIIMKYFGTKERPGSHLPFNFEFVSGIRRDDNATFIEDRIRKWYDSMPEGCWANWVIGNHDNSRPCSRFDRNLIDGMYMLQFLLPGTPIVYNGDELCMEDTFIRWDQTVDPPALNVGPDRYLEFSRDIARTPFQWDDTDNAGFTDGLDTWLPVNPNYWQVNAAAQSIGNFSDGQLTHLKIFKKLIELRRNTVFQRGDLQLNTISSWVLVMIRSYPDHPTYITLVNFGSEIVTCDLQAVRSTLPEELGVVIPSVNSKFSIGQIVDVNEIKLRPKAAVVLTTSEEEVNLHTLSSSGIVELKHEIFSL